MKNKKLIIWAIAVVVGFFIIKTLIQVGQSFNEDDAPSETQKDEYIGLFPENVQPQLYNVWNYNSKMRNQFSIFEYGPDKKYNLLTYKMSTVDHFTLDSIYLSQKTGIGGNAISAVIEQGITHFDYKVGRPEKARSIFIFYDGDSLQKTIESDSVIAYYLRFHKLAICYNQSSSIDILGEGDSYSILPVSFMFLKRNNAIYLIIATVNDYNDSMPADFLYNLIAVLQPGIAFGG